MTNGGAPKESYGFKGQALEGERSDGVGPAQLNGHPASQAQELVSSAERCGREADRVFEVGKTLRRRRNLGLQRAIAREHLGVRLVRRTIDHVPGFMVGVSALNVL